MRVKEGARRRQQCGQLHEQRERRHVGEHGRQRERGLPDAMPPPQVGQEDRRLAGEVGNRLG